ncbi:tetrapyrrole methylase [Pelagophyceae sp. CCMP2097]|nr:tetrapyrrole methylase [Pelagophyceae sp. CCMP2097]
MRLLRAIASMLWVASLPRLCGSFGVPRSSLQSGARRPRAARTLMALGRIALVGAGPGDPELLTIAALRLIQDPAALIVADRLVSPEVLALVRGELRVARKAPGCAEEAQQQIYDWCCDAVREGRDVVRLKIGDPFVFGRGGEEVLEFRSKLGIEPRIVPGVSSALAAPLAAGVPVTHRGASHQLVISTGFGRDGTSPELPWYHAHQTVVFLMAVGRLGNVTDALRQTRDFPDDCPALVVEKASRPEQRAVIGDVSDIAHWVETHQLKAPSTIVIGHSVRVLHGDRPHGLIEGLAREWNPVLDDVLDEVGGYLKPVSI